MKKQFLAGIVLVSSLTIAGCSFSIGGNSDDTKSSNSDSKSESTSNKSNRDSNNEQSGDTKDNGNESGIKDESNITEQQSIAMAMLEPSLESDIVTGDELLSGKYTRTSGAGEKQEQQVDTLELSESPELNKMKNKPDGMKFYGFSESKGSYATIIGVNKEEVVYIMTQSTIFDFNEVKNSETSKTLNISDLYSKYKDNRKVANIANKIEYGDPMPSNNEDTSNVDTNSNEYYAKVWLTALPSYRDSGDSEMDAELEHQNIEGDLLNPYNEENTVKYPKGVQRLAGTPTAAGQVVYKNNGDGTISIYDVPSHFHDERWLEDDDYSQRKSEDIINNPKVVKLYNASNDEIEQTVEMFDGSNSNSNDDSDSEDSSEKVTRENVIDKVESYEGSTLDTDTYTYKEPEKTDDGKWGFSFEDKEGNLAGSYIIDDDGEVTEYDEDGDKVGSGY
ncbi:hypothetical protein NGC67_04205 [Mammaliicoccus fleurettii]|uniref:hypothetical protein n=1 Tax=Mammaliicoccus fleurettii TaxID=150056 RepID=UPI002DB8454D|nr:hypothetical protein [Mammaliicoccus fleurettii]MEB7805872.1 hypothetical protein [Mammaliicoccus fleurettii]